MSATLSGLRRKMASAGDLQSVVRAMKAQAAASIVQYERSVAALADYQRTVVLGLGVCLRNGGVFPPPLDRRPRTVTIIVFGSDQGLVGRFNTVVGDFAASLVANRPEEVAIWTVGQRVREQMADSGAVATKSFDVPVSVVGIAKLVGELLVADDSMSTAYPLDEVYLVYNQVALPATYHPVGVQLLPLDADWLAQAAAVAWPTTALPEVLGTGATALAAFIREYLFVSLFRACAQSLAAENASRLAAMQRADKNIDDLLGGIGGEFHRLRQASIDEELFDVVAGYEALQLDTSRSN